MIQPVRGTSAPYRGAFLSRSYATEESLLPLAQETRRCGCLDAAKAYGTPGSVNVRLYRAGPPREGERCARGAPPSERSETREFRAGSFPSNPNSRFAATSLHHISLVGKMKKKKRITLNYRHSIHRRRRNTCTERREMRFSRKTRGSNNSLTDGSKMANLSMPSFPAPRWVRPTQPALAGTPTDSNSFYDVKCRE